MYLKYIFNVRGSIMRTNTSYHESLPNLVSTEKLSSGGKHRAFHVVPFLLPVIAIAIIFSQLRPLRIETLGHMAGGLAVVLCALLGLGTFLWCVRWGVSHDGE
jgi:hypothetical protein